MVVLAQALASRPTVLLVDELSLGLAPVVVKRLVPTLAAVAASGVGVLLIEQFAHVALGLANRAYVLEGGRIRYERHGAGAEGQPRAAALRLPAARLRGVVDDLAGKVAVITGGASGIGFAMAERFAAEGMRIVLADIERPVLERAAAAVGRRRGRGAGRAHRRERRRRGGGAGRGHARALRRRAPRLQQRRRREPGPARSIELPLADFEWVMGVNLFGVIHGLQAFLPRLVANDVGHIVNTASTSAFSTSRAWAPTTPRRRRSSR